MKKQPGHHNASRIPRTTLLHLAACSALLAGLQPASMAGKPTNHFFKTAPKPSETALTHSARAARRFPNPVILIHGTMGSILVDAKTRRIVWGEFSEDAGNDHNPAAIRGLALPMARGKSLPSLRDKTYAASTMNRVSLTVVRGVRVKIGFYENARERFGEAVNGAPTRTGASLDLPCNRCIQFSYDWRRSCDENAALLARFIEAKKSEFVHKHGYPKNMKFDVIAHSQGALILRYYLRYGGQLLPRNRSLPRLTWEGAPHVQNVALLGSPNAGLPVMIKHLTHGHKAKPLFPTYEAAVVGTSPSVYQMLPRARDGVLLDPATGSSLDPLDFNLWLKNEWGLANPAQDGTLQVLLPHVRSARERRAIALDHLKKCLAMAAKFQASLDRPARKPRHLHVTLYASDGKKTPLSFLATPRDVTLHREGKGDIMVPLSSALRCPADQVHVFDCSHNGLACKKKLNKHVISELLTEE